LEEEKDEYKEQDAKYHVLDLVDKIRSSSSVIPCLFFLTGGKHVEVILGLANDNGVSGVVASLMKQQLHR